MHPDIGTLFLMLFLVSAMASGFMWFLFATHRPVSGIRSIALANTLLCLGYLGIWARPLLPPLISFPIANGIVCAGYLLTLYGMEQFFGNRPHRWILPGVGLAYFAEFCYFYYVDPSYRIRLFCYLAFYALVTGWMLLLTFTAFRRSGFRSHLVACFVLAVLAVSFIACAAISLDQGPTRDILSATAVNALVVIEQVFFVVGSTMAFTLMFSERLGHEKSAAESESRMKSETLANMSHELRTPLNAIIGFADAIDNRAVGDNPAKYAEYVKDILFSGRHLLALINDILDISRIESGRVDLREEVVDVSLLVETVKRMTQPKAANNDITVSLALDPSLPQLFGDELRLRQVLVNLVTNGIKFTPRGGRVEIRTERGDESPRIIVTDTGIGMDEEGIGRALTKYCRVESAFTRGVEGFGLGLPLAKALTESHGGTLDIASTPGRGTTVTVTLPGRSLARSPGPRPSATARRPG